MQLYYHPLSGHSHRARLFFSLIDKPVELVLVDLRRGEHKSREFLRINRFGQIPVLDDDGTIVADSNSILTYLAKKFDRTDWLPDDPSGSAEVQRWLSVAAGQLAYGPAAARLFTVFGAKFDPAEVIGKSHALLQVLEDEMKERDWLVAAHPTIADVALYSYIARAQEGNVELTEYPSVEAWLGK